MIVLKYPKLLFLFNRDSENVSKCSVLSNWFRKLLGNGNNNATIKMVQPKFSPGLGEIDGKMISTWNLGERYFNDHTNQNRCYRRWERFFWGKYTICIDALKKNMR